MAKKTKYDPESMVKASILREALNATNTMDSSETKPAIDWIKQNYLGFPWKSKPETEVSIARSNAKKRAKIDSTNTIASPRSELDLAAAMNAVEEYGDKLVPLLDQIDKTGFELFRDAVDWYCQIKETVDGNKNKASKIVSLMLGTPP